MSIATIDIRGRITVPVDIRKFLGLQEGMRLTWRTKGNQTFIVGVLAPDGQAFEGLVPLYLGICSLTPKERLALISRGVTMDDFDRVAKDMQVSWEQIASWIGLAHPLTGGVAVLRTIPNQPARRLVQLAYLIGQVQNALAELDQAAAGSAPALVARWMASPTPPRRSRTSAEVLSTARSRKKLARLIEEFGATSFAKRQRLAKLQP